MKNLQTALIVIGLLLVSVVNAQSPILVENNAFMQDMLKEASLEEAKLTSMQEQFTKTENVISFEENMGQMKDQFDNLRPDVLYYGNTNGMNYYLKNGGLSYQFSKVESWEEVADTEQSATKAAQIKKVPKEISTYRVDVDWLNANKDFSVEKGSELAGYSNYYNVAAGQEPVLKVKKYEAVTLKNVWEGIDIRYYSNNELLESDYLIAAGADYKQIQFEVKGAQVSINNEGSLVLNTPYGQITEGSLKVYQNGVLLDAFWQLSPTENGGIVSFLVLDYNPLMAMLIDPPVKVWGTYYGGPGDDYFESTSIDAQNNLYVCGFTNSNSNFSSGGHQNVYGGGNFDAILVKFNSDGLRIWATYYGGANQEDLINAKVDGSGNVFMSGRTFSSNNIAFNGHQNFKAGGADLFLVKFDSIGLRIWGTYIGGSGSESFISVNVDAFDNVFISGYTSSLNNISFNDSSGIAPNTINFFLMKFNNNGLGLWGSYYYHNTSYYFEVKTDYLGNFYLVGNLNINANVSFPTGTHQSNNLGKYDICIVKLNPNGAFQWGSFFGGVEDEFLSNLIIDNSGDIIIYGGTYQNINLGGGVDVFVAKFNNSGQLLWSSNYGGNGNDLPGNISIDNQNNIYFTGRTDSESGIFFNGHQSQFNQADTSLTHFLVKFSSLGIVEWGTYYGEGNEYSPPFCKVDFSGNVYLVGYTKESLLIPYDGFQNVISSGGFAHYIAKFNSNGIRQWGSYFKVNEFNNLSFDTNNNLYLSGTAWFTDNIALNGFQNVHGGGYIDGFLVKISQELTVWPGDADVNGIVNNYDVLVLGQFYEEQGLARPNPGSLFQEEIAFPWGLNQSNGENIVHGDCNGNGTIDSFDVEVIDLNYGLLTAKGDDTKGGNIPLFLQLNADTSLEGDTVQLKVILGDAFMEANDVYGIAYTINYNSTHVKNDMLKIDYNPSWLTPNNNRISLFKTFPAQNAMDVAQTRIDRVNTSGFGEIATITVVIEDDLHGKKRNVMETAFFLSNVRLVNINNEEIGVNVSSPSILYIDTGGTSVGINDLQNLNVSVFPNPFENQLMIEFEKQTEARVFVYNINGQVIFSKEIQEQTFSINTAQWNTGAYIVEIVTDEGVLQQKLLKY